jgi:hypothetical protein
VSRRGLAIALGAAIAAGAALRGPTARAGGGGAARVDWARGFVVATGVGVADRHAPSPAAARGPARTAAEEAARRALAAALPALPLATGGALGDRLADRGLARRVEQVIADAVELESDLATDGSWRVALGVPLEALRIAITEPRTPTADEARDPAIVIVDGVAAAPALGYSVGGHAAAAVWVGAVPAWAQGAPRVRARGAARGAIALARPAGGPATLFVLVAARG